MKKLVYIISPILIIALLFLVNPIKTHAAFSYSRSITVNGGQVPSTQTNFPMLVSGTYTYLKTVGNGGKVQNANGYDVGFYTGSDCSTGKMAWETERYIATTGEVVYHVNVASISNGTVFYMCYGDSSITTDQSNASGTWNSSYVAVYHLPDGTTLTANDSTTNANTGTITGSPTAVVGEIDGAAGSFDQASNNYINITDNAGLRPSSFTGEAWLYRTGSVHATNGAGIIGKWSTNGWMVFIHPVTQDISFYTNGAEQDSGTVLGLNTWTHVVVTFDGSTKTIYVNGSSVASTGGSFTPVSTVPMEINRYLNTGSTGMPGNVDEFRFSNTALPANWITAEYNNQSAPASFYTVGSEVPFSTTPPTSIVLLGPSNQGTFIANGGTWIIN